MKAGDTPSGVMKTHRKVSNHDSLQPRLGIDIGRVIVAGDGPDTSFVGGSDDDALRAPPVEGAIEAIARLRAHYEGRVWLVSKCGPRVEARTRRWLEQRRFFAATGVAPDHVRFCRTRPEKAPICLALGITCFIDDRQDVLAAMGGVVATRLLFGARWCSLPGVTPVASWREAEPEAAAAADWGWLLEAAAR
jgi:hypothetical protein